MVAIDPRTGYIRAMASSSKYKHNQYNLAAQGHRQPGSAFKTFVLATAIKRGREPVLDQLRLAAARPQDRGLRPVEGADLRRDLRRLDEPRARDAASRTTPCTRSSTSTSGPKSVAETAKDMGITTKLDGYPAEGLGGLTRGVSPLEMANAYATLASGGIRNKPIAILRVKFPDGDVEDLGKPKRERVLSDAGRLRGDEDPQAERAVGNRHARQHRLPVGRQDRHDRQLQRRLVRRLHAAPGDGGVGRLSGRAAGDAQRARHLRRRRHLPGRDLGEVHEGRQGRRTAATSRSRRARSSGRRSSASTPRAGPATATAAATATTTGTPPAAATRATIRASTTSPTGRPAR